MSALLAKYFNFKSVQKSDPVQQRTVNKLTEHLRLIEMRLLAKQTEPIATVPRVTFSKQKFEKPNPEKKYFKWHKIGHDAKLCFKKGCNSQQMHEDAFMCSVKTNNNEVWLANSGSIHISFKKGQGVFIKKGTCY